MESDNLKKLFKKSLLDSKAYFPPVNRKDFVKLDLNESYILNDEILEEIRKIDYFTLSSYPEYGELVSELAGYANRSEEEICLTSGSDQAIQMLLNIFFKEGDQIIIPSPTFFVYFSILNLIEANPKTILYKEEGNKFLFPFKETLGTINSDSKGLLLCNPNNPLGASIPENELIELLEKTSSLGIPVIIDEAYYEFSGYTSAGLLDRFKNLIILRSFSKSFGLAGVRLGYILANKNIIDELIKLRLPWAVNHFAVHAGKVVLKRKQHFKEKVEEINSTKKELADFMRENGYKCYDTDTNFLIVKTDNGKNLMEKFKEEGILISDVSHYPHSGELLQNALRIAVPSKDKLELVKKVISINKC